MVRIPTRRVAGVPEGLQALNGDRFVGDPAERPDSRLKVRLCPLERKVSRDSVSLDGCPALHAGGRLLDALDDDVFGDLRADRHPPLARPGRRAAVDPELSMIAGAGHHPRPARPAPEHTEPGEQRIGLRFASARDDGPLCPLPRRTVDHRRACACELAEADLTDQQPGPQQARRSVITPVDTVPVEMRLHLLDGRAVRSHPDSVTDDGRQRLVYLDDVTDAPESWWEPDRRDASLDGVDLCRPGLLCGDAVVVLGDHAMHRRTEPKGGAAMRHGTDISGQDTTPGFLNPLDDFDLHLEAAYEPVEVGDGEDVGVAGFDGFDGGGESRALGERLAAADVHLFVRVGEGESFAGAEGSESAALDVWGPEPLGFFSAVELAYAYDADGVGGHDCKNYLKCSLELAKTVPLEMASL